MTLAIALVNPHLETSFVLNYVEAQNVKASYVATGPCAEAKVFQHFISTRVIDAIHLRGVRVHSKTELPYALLDITIDDQVILSDGLDEFNHDPDPSRIVWQKGHLLFPAARVVEGKPYPEATLGYMLANGQKLGAVIRKADGPMDIELEFFLDLYRVGGGENYLK